MKKTIIATLLLISTTFSVAGMSDGEAALLGIIIGTQIQRHVQQPQQPVYKPQEIYYPPQPRQNSDPCLNLPSTVEAAYCRGVQQRQREIIRSMEKEAYNRGYNGN